MDYYNVNLFDKETQLIKGVCNPIQLLFRLNFSEFITVNMPEYGTKYYNEIKNDLIESLSFDEESVLNKAIQILTVNGLDKNQTKIVFNKLDSNMNQYIFSTRWFEFNKHLKFAHAGLEPQIVQYKQKTPHLFDERIKSDFEEIISKSVSVRKSAYKKLKSQFLVTKQSVEQDEKMFLLLMAIRLLFSELKLDKISKKQKATFIELIRGKDIENLDIIKTNTYKFYNEPSKMYDIKKSEAPSPTLMKHLNTLKIMFEEIGLSAQVKEINKQINSLNYSDD